MMETDRGREIDEAEVVQNIFPWGIKLFTYITFMHYLNMHGQFSAVA
jgi:hypothetical protein